MGNLFRGLPGKGVASKPCQNIYFFENLPISITIRSLISRLKKCFRSGPIWGFPEEVAPLSCLKYFSPNSSKYFSPNF